MLQPSEEIKARLNIVDVIRDYMPLRAAGINFRARCPFHNEKTPSFMISPEKQIWHCFGCSKGGDIFAFIMEIEGVDFAGALRILAPKAGVALTKQDPKLVSEKNRVLDVLDLARKYFHKVLLESSVAANARNYLHKRGLDDSGLEEWQVGYSPDSWDTTYKFLRSKGYTEKEIFAAGLSVKSTNQPGYYDRFRGRIMFPITDANGNTVAFTARVSPEKEATETMGKYINSPQTMVYDKSKILFGWNKAKTALIPPLPPAGGEGWGEGGQKIRHRTHEIMYLASRLQKMPVVRNSASGLKNHSSISTGRLSTRVLLPIMAQAGEILLCVACV